VSQENLEIVLALMAVRDMDLAPRSGHYFEAVPA
jgi:hypothetical protein